MQPHRLRPAVAMIELIFAIVIMAFVLLSAPMLITTASTSSQATFQQESIAMVASHTNALLSYAWDEEDTESVNNYDILDTNSTNTALDGRSGISSPLLGKLRILPAAGAHPATDTVSFGTGENGEVEPDDVDDFDADNAALTVIAATSQVIDGDFMDKNISIATTVRYADGASSSPDFSTCATGHGCAYSNPTPLGATANSRNVKFITTTLTSANMPDKNITLRAFMCNIGTATPRRREGI